MRYEFMLAMRYLRSRREERFVSLVGWSSGIGVAIGVAALIVVLSVMYGFDTELKDRILGFSSHVDIQGAGRAHFRLARLAGQGRQAARGCAGCTLYRITGARSRGPQGCRGHFEGRGFFT